MKTHKPLKTHKPFFHREPNKFIEYTMEDFDDGHGNGGKKRIAHYLDKNGKQRTATAQVIWEYMAYNL